MDRNDEISTMTRPRTGSVSAQNEDELILSGRTTTGGGLGGGKGGRMGEQGETEEEKGWETGAKGQGVSKGLPSV